MLRNKRSDLCHFNCLALYNSFFTLRSFIFYNLQFPFLVLSIILWIDCQMGTSICVTLRNINNKVCILALNVEALVFCRCKRPNRIQLEVALYYRFTFRFGFHHQRKIRMHWDHLIFII